RAARARGRLPSGSKRGGCEGDAPELGQSEAMPGVPHWDLEAIHLPPARCDRSVCGAPSQAQSVVSRYPSRMVEQASSRASRGSWRDPIGATEPAFVQPSGLGPDTPRAAFKPTAIQEEVIVPLSMPRERLAPVS